jgi:hypothetical protein
MVLELVWRMGQLWLCCGIELGCETGVPWVVVDRAADARRVRF